MNSREYRTIFRFSLILSLVFHALLLLLTRIPITWMKEGPERRVPSVLIFVPETTSSPPPATREAIEVVTVEETLEEIKPLGLRESRLLPAPESLVPNIFPLEPSITWDMIMDLSHLRLLPPYYYSRFFRPYPDSTRRPYTVNDYIRLALLDALREREERGKMLLETPLGEFGVTPGVIHLGPLKLPVPFGSYSSRESRVAQREYQEIQSQESAVKIDDEDLERQRERVLEWKARQKIGE